MVKNIRKTLGYWTTTNNPIVLVKNQLHATITRFLVALTSRTFHNAFHKSQINKAFVFCALQNFISHGFTHDPAVLATELGRQI